MNPLDFTTQALARTCMNNAEAMDWLNRWRGYVHAIDDIEDEETDSEFRLATFVTALEIYTHPYWLKHGARLKQVVYNCTNAFADSVRWEKSGVPWQKEFADHYRHFAAEMVLAVACIEGGYPHMRSISLELRATCYHGHHDANGKPT